MIIFQFIENYSLLDLTEKHANLQKQFEEANKKIKDIQTYAQNTMIDSQFEKVQKDILDFLKDKEDYNSEEFFKYQRDEFENNFRCIIDYD